MKNKIKIITKTAIIYTNSMGEEKELKELDKNHLLNAYIKADQEGRIEDRMFLSGEIIRRLTIAESKK